MYETGKMGAGEGMTLVAMLILPNIYLSEPSLSIGFVGNSAWLLKICSGVLYAGILLAILKFYQGYTEKFCGGKMISFADFIRGLMGSAFARVVLILWALVFEAQAILTLREFADHTLITALAESSLPLILFLFSACITIVLWKGLEVILRAAYIFFIIATIGILVTILALYNNYQFDYLFPWQGYGFSALARHSFHDLGTWVLAFAILFLAPNLQCVRTVKKAIVYGFGWTILLKALLIAAIIMVFGILISPDRALLFYEIVQSIHLSQYLQRVDAIFIIIWLTGGLISALLMQFFVLTLLGEAFRIDDEKPLIPMLTLISALMGFMPNSVIAVIELNNLFVYKFSSVFILLNFIAFAIGYYVKCRRKKPCVGAIK